MKGSRISFKVNCRPTITREGLNIVPLSRRYSRGFTISMSNDGPHDFFRYTSGRWLYDEQIQFKSRYLEFNIQALKECAYRELGTRCIRMSKLPEGLYNKMFSLEMEDGREILARIPNPNAGHPDCIVSSEVATLDFLRNVLDIPVPKVLAWSSKPNQIGASYILMERVQICQLSEVWPNMSEKQRFALVKGLVEIERRLLSVELLAHGSIYYRNTHPEGLDAIRLEQLPGSKQDVGSKFVIGPTTERSFFIDSSHIQKIDRGPWRTAQEYLSAVAKREKFLIRNPEAERLSDSSRLFLEKRTGCGNHLLLLEQFETILPHILPAPNISRPTLMHNDLHLDNIFVDDTDQTKISSIIDWQATYASPIFLQARFPSVFDRDDPYPWGAVQPSLPKNFDALSPTEQAEAREIHTRLRLKKFYEIASRKFNPTLFTAMDTMRNHDDPISFVFHIIGQSAFDGPVPLEELLIQIYEQWDQIMERRGHDALCPLSFTTEEIQEKRQRAQEWANAYGEFESLRVEITGKDGWVSHDEYDEAADLFRSNKGRLEMLREIREAFLICVLIREIQTLDHFQFLMSVRKDGSFSSRWVVLRGSFFIRKLLFSSGNTCPGIHKWPCLKSNSII